MLLDKAKLKLKGVQAVATIKHKEERNQELIKAYRDADPDVQAAEAELIEATGALKVAELLHEKVYNHFISARKVGGMDDAEIHALMGSTIRGGVVKDKDGRMVDSETGEIVG
jgi:multidrug resistance efflux pump